MDVNRVTPRTNFNNLLEHLYSTEPREFYYILEHLFLNSDGFAVLLDEAQPWFISRDTFHDDPMMCFSVNNSYPYTETIRDSNYKNIKIRLFASTNIRTVVDYVVHNSGYLPKPVTIPNENKFTYPSLLGTSSQEELLNMTDKLEKHGFKHVELVRNGWDWNKNDLIFDKAHFPNADQMIAKIYAKGFRLTLELFPYYTTSHEPAFEYFLKDKANKPTSVLDFSRDDTCDWYLALLKRLNYENNVHSFLTTLEKYSDLTLYNGQRPNVYVQNYIETVSKAGNLTSWWAFKSQHLPMFVQQLTHEKDNHTLVLEKLIPWALSLSVAGYSFICPNPIGIRFSNDDEMFIRWTQAVSLMPCMAFYYSEWDANQNTADMMKKFVNLHIEHAPVIIELAKKRIQNGNPIVRPLWYLAPDDPKTYKIADQFMLGDSILVAPVVTVGARERSLYLPNGTWIDQHGATFIGPNEIKVAVPLEELPYFKRKL